MIDQPPMLDNHQITNPSIKPITEYCITQTAKRFSLPEIVLKSILEVEAGKVGELRVNKNGTYDIGPMQINSSWLNKFDGYVSKEDILYNGCTNIQVGAWILRYNIDKTGNLWQGIGNYHSNTKTKHDMYKNKVFIAMQKYNTNNNKG
jgi:soluble lytic murein transglycosylase-like protein